VRVPNTVRQPAKRPVSQLMVQLHCIPPSARLRLMLPRYGFRVSLRHHLAQALK
jgi:hypothetical protein